MDWKKTGDEQPPNGDLVMTKIDDRGGLRNENALLRRKGNLWFFPDYSMYVYYAPTHWVAAEPGRVDA